MQPHLVLTSTLLAVSFLAPSLAAQADWRILVRVGGHTVYIDTSATTRRADTLVVQLRWHQPSPTAEIRVVIAERSEVDCRGSRLRVLESREEFDDFAGRGQRVRAARPSEWVPYASGSLGGEVIRAVCRRYSATDRTPGRDGA